MDRVEKMMVETGMTRFQVIEQAIFRYIESGCRSLMYRLEEIEERKKTSGSGEIGDPEKTGESRSEPWQTCRETKKTETVQRDKLKKNKGAQ